MMENGDAIKHIVTLFCFFFFYTNAWVGLKIKNEDVLCENYQKIQQYDDFFKFIILIYFNKNNRNI